ncbi:hypothetical protein ACN42_g828 [Penicillium freii]|uniref:Uncharacterized protein n=1 Tax=Penicillium freii TaxID=48697 RepID=A0A117NRW8_PENFR|nr:hypothetical protein ACN42_g828 [Penicillium freii]
MLLLAGREKNEKIYTCTGFRPSEMTFPFRFSAHPLLLFDHWQDLVLTSYLRLTIVRPSTFTHLLTLLTRSSPQFLDFTRKSPIHPSGYSLPALEQPGFFPII